MFTEPVKEKIREVYQEYDNFIVYNVYNENKELLYRETQPKIVAKIDINEQIEQAIKQGSQNWVNKKIDIN